ncbi:hypothetical protein ANCCAN_28921 [Ancylostoma caninum]|uniref:Uncharacterized protein n=1 Tax=Ancylostoma caninum TaxID=29170 RepID=A0A368F140_ANCCA|nr:hypothetical protein ANCCAN_28921 [Ancylostoma caninum]
MQLLYSVDGKLKIMRAHAFFSTEQRIIQEAIVSLNEVMGNATNQKLVGRECKYQTLFNPFDIGLA